MAHHGQHIENEAAYEAAIARKIAANRIKGTKPWRDANAALIQFIDAKAERGVKFWKDMVENIEKWGKLTDRQAETCNRIMKEDADKNSARKAEYAAADAGSVYVGTLGKREEFTVTIRHVVEMETQYGPSFFHIMNDADNNVMVYKGSSRLGVKGEEEYTCYKWKLEGETRKRPTFHAFAKGETITIKASVKKYEVRNDVKQTVLQRAVYVPAK